MKKKKATPPPSETPRHTVSPETPRRHIPWAGILLVAVGVIFLLQSFGVFSWWDMWDIISGSWSIWAVLWRFWPIILVLLGIYVIWGRRNPWQAWGLIVFVVLIVAGFSFYSGRSYYIGKVTVDNFSQALGNMNSAQLDIESGATILTIDSLPADSGDLVQGEFERMLSGHKLSQSFQQENGVGIMRLATPRQSWRTWGSTQQKWRMYLSRLIPLELDLKTGAGEAHLVLTDLRISHLRLDTGASRVTVALPATGSTDVFIQAGVTDLTVIVPEGVPARIHASSGISLVSIDEERFPKSGDYYLSPNFADSANRIDLEINAGIARVKVQ